MESFDKIQFIRQYRFESDAVKSGRTLQTARVGEVYVTRLTIQQGVVTGNLYHKETNTIFFVTEGKVLFRFVQINTGQQKDLVVRPGEGIIHLPIYTAIASKNIHHDPAIVFFFSNKPFRSNDDYPYEIMPES